MADKDFYRLTFEEQLRLSPEEKMIEYWRANPIEAQKDLIGYNLNWFQRIMLREAWFHQFNLWTMGRGCSKTFEIALLSCLYAALYPNKAVGIIGPVFRQANYVFDEIRKIYDMSEYIRASTVKEPSRGTSRSILEFHNGSFIEALPLGFGDKIRGRRYRFVAIDEAAQCPIEIINRVIMPFLGIKIGKMENKLLWASSAYYKHNYYYGKYIRYRISALEQPDKYSVLEFDYHDILAEPDYFNQDYQVDMNIVREAQETMTEEEFAMEWLAKFPDDTMGFFPSILIDSCIRRINPIDIEFKSGERGARYLISIDCARKMDNFAIMIFKLVGNEKHIVRVIAYNNISYQDMLETIRRVLVDYNVVRIVMDQGGGGTTLKDYLAKPWIDTRENLNIHHLAILDMDDPEHKNLEGLKILRMYVGSQPRNEVIFNRAKAEMQHGRVILPLDVRNHENPLLRAAAKEILLLKTEMGVVECKQTPNGVRFSVPTKYNNDRLMTFVMGISEACDFMAGEDYSGQTQMPIGMFIRR